MYKYIACIYSGKFDGFVEDNLELLEGFLKTKNRSKVFFTAEQYQIATMFFVQQKELKKARKVIDEALTRFDDTNEEFLLLDSLVDYCSNNMEASSAKASRYYSQTNNPVFLLQMSAIAAINGNYSDSEEKFEQFVVEYKYDYYNICERYLHFALFLNSHIFEDKEEKDESFMERSVLIKKSINKAIEYDIDTSMLMSYASEFYKMENTPMVKILLNRLIDINPYSKEAWKMLSYVLFSDEQYAEAIEAYKTRIAIDDIDFTIYYECGSCFLHLMEPQEALYYFEKQEKTFPMLISDDKGMYVELKNRQVICLVKLGRFSEALDICRGVLTVDALNFEATVLTGQCYFLMNQYDIALEYLLKAFKMYDVKDDKDYEQMFEIIGDVFSDSAEYCKGKKKRKELLQNAISSYQKSLIHMNIKAKKGKGNFDLAQRNFAVKYMKIGRIFMLLEDTSQSLLYLQMAHAAYPDLSTLHLFSTLVYFDAGFEDEAFWHFCRIPTLELDEFRLIIPEIEVIEKEFKKKKRRK